ncbi:MAG TPA: hypothetical protein VGD37_40420 [Kofleriaceae bacterium]
MTITAETAKEKIAAAPASIDVPQLAPSVVILATYDALLPDQQVPERHERPQARPVEELAPAYGEVPPAALGRIGPRVLELLSILRATAQAQHDDFQTARWAWPRLVPKQDRVKPVENIMPCGSPLSDETRPRRALRG